VTAPVGREAPGTPEPLRILVVNWQDGENPRAGGAEIHLHEIFGRLASWGHEVTLLVSGWPGAPTVSRADGMEIHRTGGRHTFPLAAPAYFRRVLARRNFDVVVEDLNKIPLFTPAWVDSTPALLLVHHLFGSTAFREASFPVAAVTWLLERFVPPVFRRVPAVAVSESTRDDLAERGMDRGRVEVIPNGVDIDRYVPGVSGRRYEEPTVLFLGRLKRYKRVDLVIRAVHALVTAGRTVRLLIGGKGEERPALERLVQRLGMEDHVTFLGFVSEDDKLELFQRSWVHMLTSPKEGWGITNLEAAACGTPTVASDAPGLRDSVVHGTTGFLAPHGDIGELARLLEELLSDPERHRSMSIQAREFACGYSWDASARSMERALRRVVADPVST